MRVSMNLSMANVNSCAYAGVDVIAYMPSVVVKPYNDNRTSVRPLRSFGIFVN